MATVGSVASKEGIASCKWVKWSDRTRIHWLPFWVRGIGPTRSIASFCQGQLVYSRCLLPDDLFLPWLLDTIFRFSVSCAPLQLCQARVQKVQSYKELKKRIFIVWLPVFVQLLPVLHSIPLCPGIAEWLLLYQKVRQLLPYSRGNLRQQIKILTHYKYIQQSERWPGADWYLVWWHTKDYCSR